MTYYDAPTAGIQALHRLKKGEELQVKIAISYTNIENARHNLAHECAHWDFDAIRRDARREWEETLSRIQVQGGDAHQQRAQDHDDSAAEPIHQIASGSTGQNTK